ncbi:hypothetical protein WR25_25709 [Diploscapter pachys]|uniref:Uncharacterized protein n=1 Tax=Diploscapter pachys TaxID=2018661 RepID=A0A2A2LXR1_9BILA|nr:hypothetical protein WR25_25709 [Diploscapter pachys]
MTRRVETGNSSSVERVVASCEKEKEADVAEKYHDKVRDNREIDFQGVFVERLDTQIVGCGAIQIRVVSIGIDLGTTYSCVAIIEEGRPVAIHNDDGRNTLPSVVAFNDSEILVENPALDCNTDMANILYGKCLNNFRKYKSQKVIEAVVTVPAMFISDQIAETKKAIELAGLKLKCLLQEPTAAAIAYNEKAKVGNSELLVFDFGGGGQDFDSRIMKFVIDKFNKSSPDYDIYKKPKLLKRLRTECWEAKESLSVSNSPVNVHLDINDDLEMNVRLTKEKFNGLYSDLFERAMIFVDRALNMAQLSPEKIDHVYLFKDIRSSDYIG